MQNVYLSINPTHQYMNDKTSKFRSNFSFIAYILDIVNRPKKGFSTHSCKWWPNFTTIKKFGLNYALLGPGTVNTIQAFILISQSFALHCSVK